MTIKISQLGAVANLQGNTIIPMVSNLTGTLTTVQANMTQISNFITGGSSGGYGNIVPSANLTYSLGSPTQWWKDLYVSSNTIYVGGTALSVSDGTLSLDGYAVAGKDAATTPVGTVAGLNWHYANAGIVTDQLRTSAYGAGKFVAWLIGTTSSPNYYPNVALYSSDGITWGQTSTPNVAQNSYQITFGGDKFVALYVGTGNTATSTDGISWTFNQDVIPAYGIYGYEWYKDLVAYGNGRFVALTGFSTQRSVYSTDGVTWSNGSIYTGSVTDIPAIDRQGQSLRYQSLAFTSGVFVASATRLNGSGGNLIAYTTDGVTWGNIQLPWGHDQSTGYTLGAGGGAFVGVPAGSGNVGIRSTDGGRTWSNISLPEPFTYTSVLYGNGQFILLSADSNTNIAVSSDGGVTWSEVNTPYNAYYSGAYGDNTFIATGIIAGNVFNISYSTAGVDATPIGATTPSTARFTNVTVTTDLVVSGDITGATITDLYANVIAANTGMKGYVDSLSGSESIANVNMKAYVDGQVTAANAGVTSANVGMVGYVNAQVTAANTRANTANIAMVGYVGAQVTTANIGMKGYVDTAVAGIGGSSYGNANVAQFLPTYSGNIGQLLAVGDMTVFGSITAGFTFPTATFANVIFNGGGFANGYAQLNIQNVDSVGTLNSADFIATAPNGTDSTHYIDMGINGNNWSSGSWTVSGPNDGYVYINQGNLTLGTDTLGTTVKVHVGGTLAGNVVGTFNSNGLSVAGNVTGTYFIGDGSQLTNLPGGGSSYSNVNVAAYLNTAGYNLYSNINVAAYLTTQGITSYGNTQVSIYLSQFNSNIIPSANVTYSLGSITNQWKDLFVSNNTIFIGGVPLSIDAAGNLLVNGNAVSGGGGTATGIESASTISITNADSSADINILSGDDITIQGKNKTISDSEGGDITINAGNGGDADAGDAAGSGGDITIRAGQGGIPSAAYNGGFGGTLDLYGGTGGDSDPGNNRTARDGGRARLQAGSAGSNNGDIELGAVGGPVEITAGQTTLANAIGGAVTITSGQAGANALAGYVEINIPSSDLGQGGSWYFTGTGRTLEAPQDGEIWQPNAGNLSVASAGNVFIRSYDGIQHEWQFGHTGDLTLPGSIVNGNSELNFVASSSGDGGGYTTMQLVPDNTVTGPDQYIIIDPTIGAPAGHIHIRAGGTQDDSSANLYLGGENSYFGIPHGSNPNVTVAANSHEWIFGADGNITFPDSTVQTTAWTGDTYSNVQVATYLPTYTGNVAAGNVKVSNAYRFETGNVNITNESSHLSLNPDTTANALAGVKIGGSGYLLGPNSARNLTLNYGGISGALGIQANVTIGTGGSGNLFVVGNVIARDITGGNILATGTSGVLGFNGGGFAQQATSNATQVTSHFTSGNIQLMSIDLGASAVHTVTFSCNKLTTNDLLLVKHISGGLTSVYVDAYVASDGLAVIWLRDITGNGTGAFTPMLKYAIIRAPSA